MKKAILFIWFGDEKPPYIQWTLENFRRMNPGWEIRYIEYTTNQVQNYMEQNDPVLQAVMKRCGYKHINYAVDAYKSEYLKQHKDELVVYCDLDCFPIAPFDNFICSEDKKFPKWISEGFCVSRYTQKVLGGLSTKSKSDEDFFMLKGDIWCIGNNNLILFDRFIQIHKELRAEEDITMKGCMIINKANIHKFDERKKAFQEMNIELGDNFCLPQFTPIEHYYSTERNKLNKGPIG